MWSSPPLDKCHEIEDAKCLCSPKSHLLSDSFSLGVPSGQSSFIWVSAQYVLTIAWNAIFNQEHQAQVFQWSLIRGFRILKLVWVLRSILCRLYLTTPVPFVSSSAFQATDSIVCPAIHSALKSVSAWFCKARSVSVLKGEDCALSMLLFMNWKLGRLPALE